MKTIYVHTSLGLRIRNINLLKVIFNIISTAIVINNIAYNFISFILIHFRQYVYYWLEYKSESNITGRKQK